MKIMPSPQNGVYQFKSHQSDLIMSVSDGSTDDVSLCFKLPNNGPIVTARSIAEYKKFFPQLPDKVSGQLCEVGAGLSEYVYQHALNSSCSDEKPIVIDYAPYAEMSTMLVEALQLWRTGQLHNVLAEIRDRCFCICDHTKVDLYNCSLQDAAKNPSLQHRSDVLIDCCATAFYEREQPLEKMRQLLLNAKGTAFCR